MLRGAAPDKSCVVRSTAARVVIMSGGIKRREMSSRKDQIRCFVEVVWVRTSTVGEPKAESGSRSKEKEEERRKKKKTTT